MDPDGVPLTWEGPPADGGLSGRPSTGAGTLAGFAPLGTYRSVPTAGGKVSVIQNRYRLLVIEDDPELCESIADFLRFTGYEVETALDLLRRAPVPDAIVLDLILPTMSATELLAAIDGESRPPVVLMTGLAQAHLGAFRLDDVLMKPFGTEELLLRVARAVGSPAAIGEETG